jgi:hypothetical protein
MGYLKAKQLLVTLAKVQEKEKKNFNRLEIVKKMNEIKYLSTQKKVPRLTLRKEVIHLENKIEGILELEEELMKKKKHESKRIVSLKKQITNLKKKLTACQDKDLKKKVERLSHLLGDFLAKHGTKDDIELSKKILKEIKVKKRLPSTKAKKIKHGRHPVKRQKVTEVSILTEQDKLRIKRLQLRMRILKQELDQVEEVDLQKTKLLEQRVSLLEMKLNGYYKEHPELLSETIVEKKSEVISSPMEVKHTLMFNDSVSKESLLLGDHGKSIEIDLEKELPLPPPPKISD